MFDQLITGQIIKAHGLKGEVKIRSFANEPERFLSLRECALEDKGGNILQELKIKRARIAGKDVFLSFHEYPDRNSVEKLRGLYLSVKREKAQPLAADSWYVCDLIGISVYDGQERLGEVKEVLNTGHQDLLEVKGDENSIYIPLNKLWLVEVDLNKRRIEFNLPDGFLEVFD